MPDACQLSIAAPADRQLQPLRLLVASSEQESYELLRPVGLFGQPTSARAQETGVPDRTLRRKVARFEATGMRSFFEPVAFEADGRRRREVGEPHFLPHRHSSPQPLLPPLEETDWHPARHLAPDRPRRQHEDESRQEPLLADEPGVSVG